MTGDLLAFGGFFSGSDKTRTVEGGILVVMFQKVIFSISLMLNRFDLYIFFIYSKNINMFNQMIYCILYIQTIEIVTVLTH